MIDLSDVRAADLPGLALAVAKRAHQGQTDKAGEPYTGHVRRVAHRLDEPGDRAVAYLHDVLEDTEVTFGELLHLHLSVEWQRIVDDVDALTHRRHEPRTDYYARIRAAGPRAVRVKLADIADNTDPVRLAHLPDDQIVRLIRKYARAIEALRPITIDAPEED